MFNISLFSHLIQIQVMMTTATTMMMTMMQTTTMITIVTVSVHQLTVNTTHYRLL